MQESVLSASSKQSWNQVARWLALIGGVVNPIGFVLAYTVAGILRPGYSPIHQAISDLGVGPNGSLVDAIGVIRGLLLVAVEFWVFSPGTPLAPARLGGLMERVVSLETLSWYVVFGWRLFGTQTES